MAARALPDRRERLLTILVTPLMTCSARLPVYAFLIAFVVPDGTSWGLNRQGTLLVRLVHRQFTCGLAACMGPSQGICPPLIAGEKWPRNGRPTVCLA